jgi:hypothetical protein
VLVRGRRLTRAETIGFARRATARPKRELRLTFKASARPQMRGRAFLLIRDAGCYGLQVDGTTFSNTLIFQVRVGARRSADGRRG